MRKVYVMLVGALAVILASAALAEENRVDERQENQEKRIEQGIESGELNKKEARRLGRQQRRIEKKEEKAMADGELSHKEARKLERAQDRASHQIHRQKNDRQERRRK